LLKERECEEVFFIEGTSYKFAGTMGFLRKLALKGRDPAFLYDDFASGLLPPEHVINALMCGLEQVDGEDVIDNHEDIVVDFMQKAGLQESAYVARILLTHAMVGDVKKKQIREKEQVEEMQRKTKNFLSRSSKRRGLLWVAILSILTVPAYMIFSY
jgi:hypothetical protein